MTRFYVYTSAKDEVEFIEAEAIEAFAAHEFDPSSMIFSGIAIEAADFEAAMHIYQHPACGFGEYLLTDEPVVTASKRQMLQAQGHINTTHNELQAKLEYLRACLKLQMATMKMYEANVILNDASQLLYHMYGRPSHVPIDVIFKQISDAAVKAAIKYNGDTKKSG